MHFSLISVIYKIDWREAPFSLQTMRNETHKKAHWSGAIKKQKGGERASEIGGERERGGGLNTIRERKQSWENGH